MKKLIYPLVLFLIINWLFISDNCKAQWVRCNSGITSEQVHSFAQIDNYIFAGSDDGVFRTTNNGTNWTPTTLLGYGHYILSANGNDLFAGTFDGVWLSTNYGDTWSGTDTISGVTSIFAYGNYLYVGTIDGLFFSTNDGNSWTQTWNHSPVTVFKAEGIYLYATLVTALDTGGVYRSTNNGYTWTQIGLNGKSVSHFVISGYTMYACIESEGLWISRNYGFYWEHSSFLNSYGSAGAIVASGSNLIVDAPYIPVKNIYYSSDEGISWVSINQGIENVPSQVLFIANGFVFAGTWGYGVKRRLMSQFISVRNISSEIPSKFILNQNYPNPFNPTTKIKFSVPLWRGDGGRNNNGVGLVTLNIFDITGKEIATLVNEQLQPGTYETDWDASAFSSGVYFYKIVAGNYTETRKMILMK